MATSPETCRVGSLDFAIATLDQAVERTIADALKRKSSHVHLANAWSIALADGDHQLREAFGSGCNYPDGKPVVWAMQWLRRSDGTPRPSRVHGPGLFETTLRKGVHQHVQHYFLGSTPETLEKLQVNVRRRFPGIEIAGASSPPFKLLTGEDLSSELSKIEACSPHIVWVGLGTPKQDVVATYLAPRYRGVFACVGAAFDFTAGNLREAPDWMQHCGLAWLYRFAQEPRRLWRRYTYGNAKFIWIVLKQLTKERVRPPGLRVLSSKG